MAKAAVVNAGTYGTESSVGVPAVMGIVLPVAVTFTAHQNPDHSSVKDTRS